MNTSFQVIVKIPAEVIGHLAESVIKIAERICRFPTNVSAGRAEDKLRKSVAQRQEELVRDGHADTVILDLLARTPGNRGVIPAHRTSSTARDRRTPT
jgi:hypothetical protein